MLMTRGAKWETPNTEDVPQVASRASVNLNSEQQLAPNNRDRDPVSIIGARLRTQF